MIDNTTNEYQRAKALAAFARYSEVGALSVLRGNPLIYETAIKRIVDEWMGSIAAYLSEHR